MTHYIFYIFIQIMHLFGPESYVTSLHPRGVSSVIWRKWASNSTLFCIVHTMVICECQSKIKWLNKTMKLS